MTIVATVSKLPLTKLGSHPNFRWPQSCASSAGLLISKQMACVLPLLTSVPNSSLASDCRNLTDISKFSFKKVWEMQFLAFQLLQYGKALQKELGIDIEQANPQYPSCCESSWFEGENKEFGFVHDNFKVSFRYTSRDVQQEVEENAA